MFHVTALPASGIPNPAPVANGDSSPYLNEESRRKEKPVLTQWMVPLA